MLVLILFMMMTLGAIGYAVWPAIQDAGRDDGQPPTAAADDGAARPHETVSLEGSLVAQLAADEITRRQYIHAMEGLAARDDARNPLAVPPDAGSAA